MTKPITPEEARKAKEDSIPDGVFEAVNELLAAVYTGSSPVYLKQEAVIEKIIEKTGVSRDDIFNKCMLDFEPHYRRAGWSVEYDKPAYNENYEANWTFKKAKNG